VDRPINTAPTQQRAVGRIYDGVHGKPGNVLLNNLEHLANPH
jgi:hypothetical protein